MFTFTEDDTDAVKRSYGFNFRCLALLNTFFPFDCSNDAINDSLNETLPCVCVLSLLCYPIIHIIVITS